MKRMLVGLLVTMFLAGNALAFESANDEELAEIRGQAGLTAAVFGDILFDEASLTQEESMERWNAMTEEEQSQARVGMMQRIMNMEGEDRQALREEMRSRVDNLTQEERSQLFEEKRAAFASLSEEERFQMMENRRQMFESMTPEEKQALREERQASFGAGQGAGGMFPGRPGGMRGGWGMGK